MLTEVITHKQNTRWNHRKELRVSEMVNVNTENLSKYLCTYTQISLRQQIVQSEIIKIL